METTQGKAVNAYAALALMSRKQLNSFTAYKLFKLKKKLVSIVEFQSEQEQKLVAELGGTITENGAIQIEDQSKRMEYLEKHKELENLPCEVDGGKIALYMKEVPDISMADMEALEEFIDWKE